MANVLFGINIAKLINDSVAQAGGVLDGTLHKRANTTRTPGDLTSGVNPSTVDYAFKGFIGNRTDARRNGSLVSQEGQFVSILGDSLLAGIIPEQGDSVTIEGTRFEIIGVPERDPAAALYQCEVGAG